MPQAGRYIGLVIQVRSLLPAVLTVAAARPALATGQSPRAANPERPTVATHAYAVAPGYVEVEQGVSARGASSLGQGTSWDVNIKIGVAPNVQLGVFGPAYARTGAGHGIGDWGVALKLRTAVSERMAVAVVPAVT